MKMKLNKRGEGPYIDTVVFILVAVIFTDKLGAL